MMAHTTKYCFPDSSCPQPLLREKIAPFQKVGMCRPDVNYLR